MVLVLTDRVLFWVDIAMLESDVLDHLSPSGNNNFTPEQHNTSMHKEDTMMKKSFSEKMLLN